MRSRLLPQQVAGDDDAHDLVGAFEDLVHPHVAQIALDREVLEITVAAVQLQRLVGDTEAGIGGEVLAACALLRSKSPGAATSRTRATSRGTPAASWRYRRRL